MFGKLNNSCRNIFGGIYSIQTIVDAILNNKRAWYRVTEQNCIEKNWAYHRFVFGWFVDTWIRNHQPIQTYIYTYNVKYVGML